MVATPEMISHHSPYVISDTGSFTNAMFAQFFPIAKELLDTYAELNLPSATYDYCHCLLICHLKKVDEGKLEFKSENVGGSDHVYEKKVGETTYMIAFRQAIEMFQVLSGHTTEKATSGTDRSDLWMKPLAIDHSTKTPGVSDWRYL